MSSKSIKIIYSRSKDGFFLMVNGLYIHALNYSQIKAVKGEFGIPSGATMWGSVAAIRAFWNDYRPFIVASTSRPYKSVWGNLVAAAPTKILY